MRVWGTYGRFFVRGRTMGPGRLVGFEVDGELITPPVRKERVRMGHPKVLD
jgi:hypothetical protein